MKTKRSTISRRGLLTTGAVAAAGSAALAGTSSLFGQGPAVITARALSRMGNAGRWNESNHTPGTDASSRQWPSTGGAYGSDEPLLLQCRCSHGSAGERRRPRPQPQAQEAGAASAGRCRTTRRCRPGGGGGRAVIQGHGGVGIVEAVGPEVRRVRSAIVSACRELRSAAPATSVFADAPTCASS